MDIKKRLSGSLANAFRQSVYLCSLRVRLTYIRLDIETEESETAVITTRVVFGHLGIRVAIKAIEALDAAHFVYVAMLSHHPFHIFGHKVNAFYRNSSNNF